MKNFLTSLFTICLLFSAGELRSEIKALNSDLEDEIASVRVLDRGRVKPLDSLARESLMFLFERSYLKYEGEKYKGLSLYLGLIAGSEKWEQLNILPVKHLKLRERLGVSEEGRISPLAVLKNEALIDEAKKLEKKREADKRSLSNEEEALLKLASKANFFRIMISGQALFHTEASADKTLLVAYQEDWLKFFRALKENKQENLLPTVQKIKQESEKLHPGNYAIDEEIQLNLLHPFRWSWICYLLSFFMLIFPGNFRSLLFSGWALALTGFAMHSYGFALRVIVAERPPVTNMYESVIWVSYGILLFSFIFEALYKKGFAVKVSTILSGIFMIVADQSPTVLDASINPLEPVLRDNFWLTTHVLIITISYAAYALAYGVSNYMVPLFVLEQTEERKKRLKFLEHLSYRSLQVGVILLAAGTILGGIWADYSWGRFWGWDPKEVWALVALLCYLAVLHARRSGMLKEFGFACLTVLSFMSVIMAWYGVNFVLGAGLHSYGFGGGGAVYMGMLCVVQMIYLAVFAAIRKMKSAKLASS